MSNADVAADRMGRPDRQASETVTAGETVTASETVTAECRCREPDERDMSLDARCLVMSSGRSRVGRTYDGNPKNRGVFLLIAEVVSLAVFRGGKAGCVFRRSETRLWGCCVPFRHPSRVHPWRHRRNERSKFHLSRMIFATWEGEVPPEPCVVLRLGRAKVHLSCRDVVIARGSTRAGSRQRACSADLLTAVVHPD